MNGFGGSGSLAVGELSSRIFSRARRACSKVSNVDGTLGSRTERPRGISIIESSGV